MLKIQFRPIATERARALRMGGCDAYGREPERSHSDGGGNPCRHCLRLIAKGEAMLTLAYRPFAQLQPYAETGPIFLCAEHCTPWQSSGLPPFVASSPDYLLKAYGHDGRICYGNGKIVPQDELIAYASALLARKDIAFVDLRSARNGCFLSRITRI